jgi:hypothetical protein
MCTTLACSNLMTMSPLVCAGRDRLLAHRRLPLLVEGRVGIGLVLVGLGGLLLQPRHVGVRDDLGHRRLQHLVAAGVIAVVVRVDQVIDLARGLRLQPVEKQLGGVGELAVDDDDRVGRHEQSDRAAAGREDADVAADVGKRRDHRRLGAAGRLGEEQPVMEGPDEPER